VNRGANLVPSARYHFQTQVRHNMVAMTPRMIGDLPSEGELRVYEMLGLRVTSGEDWTLEITRDLAGLSFGKPVPSYPSRS
jgi:hypothetical protein